MRGEKKPSGEESSTLKERGKEEGCGGPLSNRPVKSIICIQLKIHLSNEGKKESRDRS